ncbi:hypothetical protein LAWI1_G005247 [Lachnellula willkommii]|uniref:Uncharacterized protein n=1 Tax=Lachnellula willkommii TaxID=215461 RepID=A0A559MB62_9HELO|nr:hypothetical protein LAWI1_G005247 [Lachnellula willkommii]
MSLMRLLQCKPDGEIVFCEPTSSEDIEASADISKTVNTYYINKKNIVKLGAGINSIFWWY